MTKAFWQSKSDRAMMVFLAVALPFLLIVALDISPRPAFVVTQANEPRDGVVELRWDRALKPGLRVLERALVRTRSSSAILVYDGTELTVAARTNIEIRSITSDRIELLATRGHWSIRPDREIKTCTRAVCTTSSSLVEIYYYTPGEVVEITAGGPTHVTFKDLAFDLESGERLVVDELTDRVDRSRPVPTGVIDLVRATP